MDVRIDPSWKEALAAEWDKPYFKALTDFVRLQYATQTVYPPRGESSRPLTPVRSTTSGW